MKCEKCNVEMMKGEIEGQHPFELGVNGESKISISVETGEQGEFLGIKYPKTDKYYLIAYVCPKCKKVEFYVDDSN